MTFGLAALMALFKGRSRLRRRRRLVVCLSALARSPLRCDMEVPFSGCVYNQVEMEARFGKGASNRT